MHHRRPRAARPRCLGSDLRGEHQRWRGRDIACVRLAAAELEYPTDDLVRLMRSASCAGARLMAAGLRYVADDLAQLVRMNATTLHSIDGGVAGAMDAVHGIADVQLSAAELRYFADDLAEFRAHR